MKFHFGQNQFVSRCLMVIFDDTRGADRVTRQRLCIVKSIIQSSIGLNKMTMSHGVLLCGLLFWRNGPPCHELNGGVIKFNARRVLCLREELACWTCRRINASGPNLQWAIAPEPWS